MNISVAEKKFEKMDKLLSGNNLEIETLFNKNSKQQKTNIIWSSKDVISSSLKVIKTLNFEKGDLVEREKELYSLIVAIDKILEAMEQINRVVFDTTDQIDFKSSIFVNDDNKCDLVEFSIDDREYFKNIRAIFTAHSSNLKLRKCKRGECKEAKCKGSECKDAEFKFASSWILDNRITHPGDYGCRVYSVDESVKDLSVGVTISDLVDFLNEIFKRVDIIIDKIIEMLSTYIFSEINAYRKTDEFKTWKTQSKKYHNEMRKVFKLFTLKSSFEQEEAFFFKECVTSYYYLINSVKDKCEYNHEEIEDVLYVQCPDDISLSFGKIRGLPEKLSSFEDEKFTDNIDDLESCVKYLIENGVNVPALKQESSFIDKLILVKSCMYIFNNNKDFDENDWKMPEIIVYHASAIDKETEEVVKGKEYFGRNFII